MQLALCSLCGGVLLRSSCASCYAHARERRDLVAAHRLYRTALFWMADLTKIQGRRVCRPFAPECSSITKIEWLQRSPRVPPQLRFSNLRLGEETANAPLVYLPTYTSGLHSEPHSLKRTSQMQTASTAAPTSYIDLYIAKACQHALCSTILYTATIQPLYSPRK